MAAKKTNDKLNHIKNLGDASLFDYGTDIYGYEDYYVDNYSDYFEHSRYWYDEYLSDVNRYRNEKLDILLGLNDDPSFADIIPESLKNLHK